MMVMPSIVRPLIPKLFFLATTPLHLGWRRQLFVAIAIAALTHRILLSL